jgi:hypothetical protein
VAEVFDQRLLGEQGLELALGRLGLGVQSREPFDYLIPFAEALAWIYSLHEWHRERLDRSSFFRQAQASTDGEALLGIIWARGAVTHRLTNVTEIVMDLTRSGILGKAALIVLGSPGIPVLQWVEEANVPAKVKPDRYNRDMMYARHVAGQPLLPPLEVARSFLMSLS